jgi:hypothetical protein
MGAFYMGVHAILVTTTNEFIKLFKDNKTSQKLILKDTSL